MLEHVKLLVCRGWIELITAEQAVRLECATWLALTFVGCLLYVDEYN